MGGKKSLLQNTWAEQREWRGVVASPRQKASQPGSEEGGVRIVDKLWVSRPQAVVERCVVV